ncbi:MAG: hypothetical protein Kow00117_10700 [Phototrophicales bacterium]
MPKIFISYRRSDTRAIAGRLYDRLEMAFGDDNVFKDVDDITPGADFRMVLRRALDECDVLLVLIGKEWAQDKRLFDDDDFVRFEVATALQHEGMTVIPVLVDGAQMPTAHNLPDDLQALAYRNAVVIRHDPDFRRDVERLIDQLNKIVTSPKSSVRVSASPQESKPSFGVGVPSAATKHEQPKDGVALGGLLVGGGLAVLIVVGILLATLIINTDDSPESNLDNLEVAQTDIANGRAPFGWHLHQELYLTETTAVSNEPGGEPYEPHTLAAGKRVVLTYLDEEDDDDVMPVWEIVDGRLWFYIWYEPQGIIGWLPADVLEAVSDE